MTLTQITKQNFSRLLRSVDPSPDLLGRLRLVPFVEDRIRSIREQHTDDQKNDALLNVLCEVPHDIQESVMNGFISALRGSGQDHVANVFHRISDEDLMSGEHYKLLAAQKLSLCQFLNSRDGLTRCLTSSNVFSETDGRKILSKAGLDDMAEETVNILLRKSDSSFDKFVSALNQTNQSHVAYILTGEGSGRPLKEEHRRRLLSSSRDKLVNMMDSTTTGLVSSLMSKGVFSSVEEQRVTSVQPNTNYDRNEIILNLISRKSQSDFFYFISALNDTGQTHVVVKLIGADVVAKIKTVYESGIPGGHMPDVDAELIEYIIREMFQRNGEEVKELNKLLSSNGVAVSDVRQGCIQVTFTCKTVKSLRKFHDLYDSEKLENMIDEAFCLQFAKKGLKSLKVVISNEQFEKCAETFARWIPITPPHRKALLSSEQWLKDNMVVNDDLLDKLSLCRRRRQAIETAGTRKQKAQTLTDITSRQPDSAFAQLVTALKATNQHEAADMIRPTSLNNPDEQPKLLLNTPEMIPVLGELSSVQTLCNSRLPYFAVETTLWGKKIASFLFLQ